MTTFSATTAQAASLLAQMGADLNSFLGNDIHSISPISGSTMASLRADTPAQVTERIGRAQQAFLQWRTVPAPRRGELIRLFGEELRQHKQALGELVTLEAGKILQEGLGEVQEMIDICDFAVGLSRQLYGLTIASERPGHRMMEQWHPVGVVGVLSAFNFPVAVWAWNAALAFVCGDSVVWKPSEKTPLTAIATHALFMRAVQRFGSDAPEGLAELIIGGRDTGAQMVDDKRVSLVSATGSTRMGKQVAEACAKRLTRTILELGGNNAMIVAPSADLEMAVRAITFSAVGTAGQRCTTLRRLFVHDSVYDQLIPRLKKSMPAYRLVIRSAKARWLVRWWIRLRSMRCKLHWQLQSRMAAKSKVANASSSLAAKTLTTCVRRWWKCHPRRQPCTTKPSHRSCTSFATAICSKRYIGTTTYRKVCLLRSLPQTCVKLSCLSVQPVRTAALPT
jgi:acyl-CoA reductase-like NAD-dependent aldehyde dehydrogenase